MTINVYIGLCNVILFSTTTIHVFLISCTHVHVCCMSICALFSCIVRNENIIMSMFVACVFFRVIHYVTC